MEKYKVKSLTPELSNEQIKNGCYSVRFISFEAAIDLFVSTTGVYEKPLGYRVSEKGIEILYK